MRSHHTPTWYEPKVNLILHSTAHTTVYNGSVASVIGSVNVGAVAREFSCVVIMTGKMHGTSMTEK